MWPDRVSNPGPLSHESGALPTALHGPAGQNVPIHLEQPIMFTLNTTTLLFEMGFIMPEIGTDLQHSIAVCSILPHQLLANHVDLIRQLLYRSSQIRTCTGCSGTFLIFMCIGNF